MLGALCNNLKQMDHTLSNFKWLFFCYIINVNIDMQLLCNHMLMISTSNQVMNFSLLINICL